MNVGDRITGKVIKIMPFGAFIEIDGSELIGLVKAPEVTSEPLKLPEDVLAVGQVIQAVILAVNQNQQVILSIKRLDQGT